MPGKYEPWEAMLRTAPADEEVRVEVSKLAELVGGLPPSARTPMWWANTAGHPQALAWLAVGRRAQVDLASGHVVFSPAGEVRSRPAFLGQASTPRRTAWGLTPIMDGVATLDALIRRAGYLSVTAAIAEHSVFLDPATVAQTGGHPVFPVIRDMLDRGKLRSLPDGRRVMTDDNTTPTWAFLWAARRGKGVDVQINHVWTESQSPERYTALWNLCVTPAWAAKTTDGSNHPEVRKALHYRSFELYGVSPPGGAPSKPDGYDGLRWAPMPEPVASLEGEYRSRLRSAPKSRMAFAAREIGWLFSGWVPDQSIPDPRQKVADAGT